MKKLTRLGATFGLLALLNITAHAQGTAFTYQGRLNATNVPVTGSYDFGFVVCSGAAGVNFVSGIITNTATPVSNGLFTVTLDFGAGVFNGADRWLALFVRTNGGGAFTTLLPRQPLTATPYAMMASTASNVLGTVSSGLLSSNVALLDATQNFSAAHTFADSTLLLRNSGNTASTTLRAPNGTAARTLTAPDASGTLISTGNLADITAVGTVSSGAWQASPISAAYGGLGTDSSAAANGSTLYKSGAAWATLAPGINGQVLKMSSGLPTWGTDNTGGSGAAIATNVVAGINITNAFITNSVFAGNGGGLTNLSPASFSAGTAAINISGNAATATSASSAVTANNFSGALAGDVTGTQGATVVTANIPRLNTANTFTGVMVATNPGNQFGGTFNGSIAGLSSFTTSGQLGARTLNVGTNNTLTGNLSSIGGGLANNNSGPISVIGGGENNTNGASTSVIGGGQHNLIGSAATTVVIGGGGYNSVGDFSTGTVIGGGNFNTVGTNSDNSFIGGGIDNVISDNSPKSVIVGGYLNVIGTDNYGTFMGGGQFNDIGDSVSNAVVLGGRQNEIATASHYSVIGGGYLNSIEKKATNATIGGGGGNLIRTNATYATIGGGGNNLVGVNADYGTIAGGWAGNIGRLSGYSFLGGGSGNIIGHDSPNAVIVGGNDNSIGDNAEFTFIGGGVNNTIPNGEPYAMILGGDNNTARDHSFAAGSQANAAHTGAFVWGDNSGSGEVFSFANNSFTVRAAGGYRLYSNSTTNAGVSLAAGGTAWAVISDRNVKKDFAAINAMEILEKLSAMPITQWRYNWENAETTPHIGPMAQDFKAAFYPGTDDKSITTLEADGVAFAAIQGLNEKLNQKLEQKETEITELKNKNLSLEQRLEKLEQRMQQR